MSRNSEGGTWTDAIAGRRVVLTLYLIIVGITALFGVLIGYYGGSALEPIDWGVVTIPPTPLGFALYGVVTVGSALGLLLALMTYLSSLEKGEDGGERER